MLIDLFSLSCGSILALAGIYFIYTLVFQTPFYPSSTKSLNLVLKKLEEEKINLNNKTFVDLGSGDGRVVFWADKNGFKAFGIELNPFFTLFTKLLIKFSRRNITIINESFYKTDLRNFDIIYLYIYPEAMTQLLPKLQAELKKGSIIISNTFKFKTLTEDLKIDKFYIYFIK